MQVSEESRDMVDVTEATTVTTEPLGETATERLKNKLKGKDEYEEKMEGGDWPEEDREVKPGTPEAADQEVPDEAFEQEEPKPKAKRKRKAKAKAKAKPEHEEADNEPPEDLAPKPDPEPDGMGGDQPALKTVEEFIAEAKTSEDLTRLNEEVRHRFEGDEITKQRQMELVQLIHNRSLEIAKGK
jgi:hypothetical protein